jgi:hypothetical protein
MDIFKGKVKKQQDKEETHNKWRPFSSKTHRPKAEPARSKGKVANQTDEGQPAKGGRSSRETPQNPNEASKSPKGKSDSDATVAISIWDRAYNALKESNHNNKKLVTEYEELWREQFCHDAATPGE